MKRSQLIRLTIAAALCAASVPVLARPVHRASKVAGPTSQPALASSSTMPKSAAVRLGHNAKPLVHKPKGIFPVHHTDPSLTPVEHKYVPPKKDTLAPKPAAKAPVKAKALVKTPAATPAKGVTKAAGSPKAAAAAAPAVSSPLKSRVPAVSKASSAICAIVTLCGLVCGGVLWPAAHGILL